MSHAMTLPGLEKMLASITGSHSERKLERLAQSFSRKAELGLGVAGFAFMNGLMAAPGADHATVLNVPVDATVATLGTLASLFTNWMGAYGEHIDNLVIDPAISVFLARSFTHLGVRTRATMMVKGGFVARGLFGDPEAPSQASPVPGWAMHTPG